MRTKLMAVAVAALGLTGAAPAPAPAPAAPPPPVEIRRYLTPEALDTYKVLPPAPVAGTARYDADRTVFRQTRKFEGTPRWDLAKADDRSAEIFKGMSCALGVELTPLNAPKTSLMFRRVGREASLATNRPKDIYRRQRPFLIDEGPICIERNPALAESPDYPSGHNTWGWSVGLILAELAPDRATQILARARAFGESRLVCGVHNMSAVHMGWANGSMLVAALHGSAEFRSDLEAARAEVAAARAKGPAPDPAACAKEAELIAAAPY